MWTRGERRARGAAAVLAALLVSAVLAVLPAGPALAAVSCSFDSGSHTDAVTSTSALVSFSRHGDDLDVNGTACGTVNTVDIVSVDLGAVSDGFLEFDLGGGQFAPGFSGQGNRSAEISFRVTNLGSGLRVFVGGTAGPDKLAVGDRFISKTMEFVTGMDLNGFADASNPGEDVVLHGRPQEIAINGTGGDDVLTGAGSGMSLSSATNVNMALADGRGADTLTGGGGNDIIEAQEGPDPGDTFSGGGGFDFIDYESWQQGATVSLDGTANDGSGCPSSCDDDNVMPDFESIRGTSFDDSLTGSPGPDRIEGLGGTNVISGRAGDDQLSGGTGADWFSGGPGFDSVGYFGETDPITVTLDGNANDGAANESDNVMPNVEEIFGGFGNDHLVGGAKANTLIGGRGDDVLKGGGGNDTLDGGGIGQGPDGSDVFIGGGGLDTVIEDSPQGNLTLSIDGVKNDQVVGDASQGIDNIHTDVENVTGGSGNDRIAGDGAANVLSGGPGGNDTLVGGDGNDHLVPGSGQDTLRGGAGTDTAMYVDALAAVTVDLLAQTASGDGDDTLAGIENVNGSDFGDHLVGSNGPNVLRGGEGGDTLKGLGGSDSLYGGPGADTIDGGAGSDLCQQGAGSGPITNCEK